MAPLLVEQASHSGRWACSTCVEEYNDTAPNPWSDTSAQCLVCETCIRSRFDQALQFDYHMPATWGELELDIDDYVCALLDADFVLAYSTAWFRKIIRETSRPRDPNILAAEMPNDWELGKQCQRCPLCRKGVQLKEACNHMVCPTPCDTDYCYICGEEIAEEDLHSHWTTGGCPQYGHPDDPDATFAPDDGYENEAYEPYVPTKEERLAELYADFHGFHAGMVLAFTWNLTMQTTDERTQRIMTDILTIDENFNPHLQTDDDIDRVLAAMTEYRESHGVDRVEWNCILNEYSRFLRIVLTRAEYDGGLRFDQWNDTLGLSAVTSGVLNRPVGGVLHMVTRTGRLQAYEWAHARGMAWRAGTTQRYARENFGMFLLGPGGTNLDHQSAQSLLWELVRSGARVTRDRVDFRQAGIEGRAVLVEILPAADVVTDDEANPLRDIRDWFLDPESVDGGVWEEPEVQDARLLRRNPE